MVCLDINFQALVLTSISLNPFIFFHHLSELISCKSQFSRLPIGNYNASRMLPGDAPFSFSHTLYSYFLSLSRSYWFRLVVQQVSIWLLTLLFPPKIFQIFLLLHHMKHSVAHCTNLISSINDFHYQLSDSSSTSHYHSL